MSMFLSSLPLFPKSWEKMEVRGEPPNAACSILYSRELLSTQKILEAASAKNWDLIQEKKINPTTVGG